MRITSTSCTNNMPDELAKEGRSFLRSSKGTRIRIRQLEALTRKAISPAINKGLRDKASLVGWLFYGDLKLSDTQLLRYSDEGSKQLRR